MIILPFHALLFLSIRICFSGYCAHFFSIPYHKPITSTTIIKIILPRLMIVAKSIYFPTMRTRTMTLGHAVSFHISRNNLQSPQEDGHNLRSLHHLLFFVFLQLTNLLYVALLPPIHNFSKHTAL